MKSAFRGSQSAAPVTKSAHRGSQSVALATKSANEPYVQKYDSLHLSRNLSSLTIAVMSKVLHLPRKLSFEVKQLRPLHLSRKIDFGAPKYEVSLVSATKSHHHVRKCTRHHNESVVARSTQILRACAIEMHSDDVERHEYIVNSSELTSVVYLLP